MAKKTKGIDALERDFDFKVEIINTSPIYTYCCNKISDFLFNMKYLVRYLDSNLTWKVKVGKEDICEEFTHENLNRLLEHYKDGNNVILW